MTVAKHKFSAAWLLLAFTLPAKAASQRVEVWRKLQRYGAIPLGNSGYLLPQNPVNLERLEWLAAAVRKHSGEASVVMVQAIDNLSTAQLRARFDEARKREYQELIRALKQVSQRRPERRSHPLRRLRARFLEIVEVDFFHSPFQKRVEEFLGRVEAGLSPETETARVNVREYAGKTWLTRPRPGIDRSASAWLIQHFIDKKASFVFAAEDAIPAGAVPFDMFHGGFGHRGDDCTFETLRKEFRIQDRKIKVIGEIIHDADVLDEKFGRKEGFGIDAVLDGWAKEKISDTELLERGIQLIEALYRSISGK
ncbi:MAG TPA: chromate resistance protein ChrB domain-containing protein [Candidatus Acidoferrales bacterium]|nr:chromate resistance protein ChrB domain-containing protein [Candidatus Acidoferrales bacterium]